MISGETLVAGVVGASARRSLSPTIHNAWIAAAGIDAEIVPGVMPIGSFAGVQRMAAMCRTDVPGWLVRLFEGLDDLPAARQLVAATVAAELCRKLYAGGVKQLHFYTMNKAELSYAICHLLGARAKS